MSDFSITTKVTLTNTQISDILCSAFEGSSTYWCQVVDYIEPTTWEFVSESKGASIHYAHDYPLNPGGAVLCSDIDETYEPIRLDRDAVMKGLSILAKEYPHLFAAILNENADAITGDILLQLALFGEVIYA